MLLRLHVVLGTVLAASHFTKGLARRREHAWRVVNPQMTFFLDFEVLVPLEPPFRELSNDVWVEGSRSSILYGNPLLTALYRPTSRDLNIVILYILMSVS